MSKNKKGVSIAVAYVLLVVMALAVSVWVYGWLRGNVNMLDTAECPEDVVVQITDYNYDDSANLLNLTITNKGFFNIEGFRVRVNDDAAVDFGVYTLNLTGKPIGLQDSVNMTNLNGTIYYNELGGTLQWINSADHNNVDLKVVDVQPYITKDGDTIYCKNVATQKLP